MKITQNPAARTMRNALAVSIAAAITSHAVATEFRSAEIHPDDYPTTQAVKQMSETLKKLTNGKGVDVILDMVAGAYIAREIECMAEDGRLVVIAVQGGIKAEFNAGLVLRKRLTITGSTLRPRSLEFKTAIAKALKEKIWPLLESGAIKPVIHSTFAAVDAKNETGSQAAQAHTLMESNQHIGKIVLTWTSEGHQA